MKRFISLLCLTTLLSIILTTSCTKEEPVVTDSVTNGLIGYWSFDNNVLDGTSNENHGINNGGTFAKDRKDNEKGALQLNGIDQYVELPHSESIDFKVDSDFTISLWMSVPMVQEYEAEAGDIHNTFKTVISKLKVYEDWRYPFILRVNTDLHQYPNQATLQRSDNGSPSNTLCNNSIEALRSDFEINDSRFRHYVIKKHNNLISFYIDNQKVSSDQEDVAECDLNGTNPLIIGVEIPNISGQENRAHKYFKGSIDELRIYNRGISNEEISLLFNE